MARAQAMQVVLEEEVRAKLERTASSARAEVRAALRARIVLAAACGDSNVAIARAQRVSVNTVRKWRRRFAATGLPGLQDAPRPWPPVSTDPRCASPWWRLRPALRRTRSRPSRTERSPLTWPGG
jgi:transposase-like protein